MSAEIDATIDSRSEAIADKKDQFQNQVRQLNLKYLKSTTELAHLKRMHSRHLEILSIQRDIVGCFRDGESNDTLNKNYQKKLTEYREECLQEYRCALQKWGTIYDDRLNRSVMISSGNIDEYCRRFSMQVDAEINLYKVFQLPSEVSDRIHECDLEFDRIDKDKEEHLDEKIGCEVQESFLFENYKKEYLALITNIQTQIDTLHEATALDLKILKAMDEEDLATINEFIASFQGERGSGVNQPLNNGHTLLHEASLLGKVVVVKHLLDMGADPSQISTEGYCAIHFALKSNHSETLKILELLQQYWKKDESLVAVRGPRGQTPLHVAAMVGNELGMHWLIQHQAEVNAQETKAGGLSTPMHYAVMGGFLNAVHLLLSRRANPLIQNAGEESSLAIAVRYERMPILQLFLSHGYWLSRNETLELFCPGSPSDDVESMGQCLQVTIHSYLDKVRQMTIDNREAGLPAGLLPESLQEQKQQSLLELQRNIELQLSINDEKHLLFPSDCYCPISQKVMEDPVIASDGRHYDRSSIEQWFKSKKKHLSPCAREVFRNENLVPDPVLRNVIEELRQREEQLKITRQKILDQLKEILEFEVKKTEARVKTEAEIKAKAEAAVTLVSQKAQAAVGASSFVRHEAREALSYSRCPEFYLIKCMDEGNLIAFKKELEKGLRNGSEILKKMITITDDTGVIENTTMTLLNYACRIAQPEMVVSLLEKGADILQLSKEGYSCMHEAARIDRGAYTEKVFDALMKHWNQINESRPPSKKQDFRVMIDVHGPYQRTPLHTAALYNNITAARWLFSHGANVNSQEDLTISQGLTPLMNATMGRHEKMVGLLLEFHANPKIRNRLFESAIDVAIFMGDLRFLGWFFTALLRDGYWLSDIEIKNMMQYAKRIHLPEQELEKLLTESLSNYSVIIQNAMGARLRIKTGSFFQGRSVLFSPPGESEAQKQRSASAVAMPVVSTTR